MATFGRFDPGARAAPRMKAGLVAVLSNIGGEYSSTVIDVSRTGMQLSGVRLPAVGEDVLLRTENVRAWGQVVRQTDDICAVEFATPIASAEVERLQCLADIRTRLTPP